MIALKNVLVAANFSENAATALMYGRALARQFGATLHVIHVVDDLFVRLGFDAYVTDTAGHSHDPVRTARLLVEGMITAEDRRQLRAEIAIVSSSSPAEAIVSYAGRAGIDLIVMGTHGHGRITDLLLGDVAEKVVRSASCPVLTVKKDEHEFVTPDAVERSLVRPGQPEAARAHTHVPASRH